MPPILLRNHSDTVYHGGNQQELKSPTVGTFLLSKMSLNVITRVPIVIRLVHWSSCLLLLTLAIQMSYVVEISQILCITKVAHFSDISINKTKMLLAPRLGKKIYFLKKKICTQLFI